MLTESYIVITYLSVCRQLSGQLGRQCQHLLIVAFGYSIMILILLSIGLVVTFNIKLPFVNLILCKE